MSEPIGSLMDAQGIELTLQDDDMVTAAVCVVKVVQSDGSVRLSLAWSEGLSWIERLGMLTAAAREDLPPTSREFEED